jgi:hypothetical protein
MNRNVIAAIVFVVVTGGMYVLCGNAHIDIFPCEKAETERTYSSAPFAPPPRIVKREGTCSLLAHNRGEFKGEYERLTMGGWALLAVFCAGIGAVAAVIAGLIFRKKPASMPSASGAASGSEGAAETEAFRASSRGPRRSLIVDMRGNSIEP